jgi:hypothetical protein
VTGVHIMDVGGKLYKHRLDKDGNYLGFHDLVNSKYISFSDGRRRQLHKRWP